MATRNLNATGWGYVRSDNANTHYNVADNTWYNLFTEYGTTSPYLHANMLVKYSAMPSSLKRKKLLGATLILQGKKN